jgi:hypothetical protein
LDLRRNPSNPSLCSSDLPPWLASAPTTKLHRSSSIPSSLTYSDIDEIEQFVHSRVAASLGATFPHDGFAGTKQDPLSTRYAVHTLSYHPPDPMSTLMTPPPVLVRYHLPTASQTFSAVFSSPQQVYVHPSAGGEDEACGSIYLKTVVQGVLMAR